ncbi:MAG: SCO family protein [Steroidobacteraceae bacterium]|nr:SCO family protein [Steroidobacteraceae bacterium]
MKAAPACMLAAICLMLGPAGAKSVAACREGEVFIPAGSYQPFFKSGSNSREVRVDPICLSASPVTNEKYQNFVRRHAEWRKSRIKALFAEDTYLADWHDDLTPPPQQLTRPATSVSWFAAGAYCEAQGGRLPTVAEWEHFGGNDGGARAGPGSGPFVFAMGRKAAELAHTPLEFAGVWEWTSNFNSAAGASLFCGDGFRAVDSSNYAAFLRYSFRSSLRANYALKNLGFRCARGAADERSIYQLGSSWVEADGRRLKLQKFAGDVQVLLLMFTTCTGTCPGLVKGLQMVSRDLPEDIAQRTRFLLITVDPEQDTIAALRRYRGEMKLDRQRWKLLRGSADDVRELAAVLGFNYEQINSGQFMHSSLITVLDARGQIVHQQNGITANSGSGEGLIAAIQKALSAEAAAPR